MAPLAAQGTALEEDHGSYSRPVMKAEFLNIRYQTRRIPVHGNLSRNASFRFKYIT
jgi:hypothetical protein